MIKNLTMELKVVSDDCFVLQVFGRNIEVLSSYEDVDGFIDEFCEEWDIDTFTLNVIEM